MRAGRGIARPSFSVTIRDQAIASLVYTTNTENATIG